ncbi:MAG: hypothetical protein KJN97_01000 [Deltaproteobacteria bacterium]|nr:hypothetical protein [Deltaproteobacteria bacterium]
MEERIAWILGAGFSAPLGLPLAKDIFAERYVKLAEGFIAPWVVPPKNVQSAIGNHGGFQTAGILIREAKQAFQARNPAPKPKGKSWSTETQMRWLQRMLEPALMTSGRLKYVARARAYRDDLNDFETAAQELFLAVERLYGDEWGREAFETAQQAQLQLAKVWYGQQGNGRLYTNGNPLDRSLRQQRQEIADELAKVRQVEAQKGWTAEQILVSLERAANGDMAHQRIWTAENDRGDAKPAANQDPATYARDALSAVTKLIVAELECLIPDAGEEAGYAWGPYIDWAKKLVGAEDGIISFNYDRVVEKGFELAGRDLGDGQLLKMHGSVTDGETEDPDRLEKLSVKELRRQLQDPEVKFTVRLGLPGDAKSKIHRPGGPLEDVWAAAASAIREARHVVFVGYSLPPEDVESMEMITEAIRERRVDDPKSALTVHLVLGPGEWEAGTLASIMQPYGVDPQNTRLYTQHAFVNWPKTGYPRDMRGLARRPGVG